MTEITSEDKDNLEREFGEVIRSLPDLLDSAPKGHTVTIAGLRREKSFKLAVYLSLNLNPLYHVRTNETILSVGEHKYDVIISKSL